MRHATFGLGVLFIIIAGCCTHQTNYVLPKDVPVVPQHPIKTCLPGLVNFGVVSKDVLRGATPSREGFQTLANLGVKTVIHLGETDETKSIPAGMKYVRLPISAFRSPYVNVYAVLRAIRDNPKPVYICCYTGADRTGVAVAAYRLSQGMSVADSMAEVWYFYVKPWFYLPIKWRLYELQKEGLSPTWWESNGIRPTPARTLSSTTQSD